MRKILLISHGNSIHTIKWVSALQKKYKIFLFDWRPINNAYYKNLDNVILLQKYVGNCFHLTEFKIGDSVCVKQGPLTGLRGKIDKLNKNKLYIHVDVIPGSVMVEIDQDHVQLEGDHLYSIVKNI